MTPYDDLKARAQKALDADDFGALRGLFVDTAPVTGSGGAQPQGGPKGPPPGDPSGG